MEGPGEITSGRSKGQRRTNGALRFLETVAVWLVVVGLFGGLAWGVTLAVRDGIGRIDEIIVASQGRTSVAYIDAVEPIAEEPVVAPEIGAPPPGDPSELIEVVRVDPPRWLVVPNPRYPLTEGEMVSGSVALHCDVTTAGLLTECEILEETPAGRGFGAAALEATRTARLSPRTFNGEPTAGEVRFSVRFTPR